MMNPKAVRHMTGLLIGQSHRIQTEVQGFGMFRIRVSPTVRIHIWHRDWMVPGVSLIHDHLQWDFHSHVVVGMMKNTKYVEAPHGREYRRGVITAGVNAGQPDDVRCVRLAAKSDAFYFPGDSYAMNAPEIHQSTPEDGTITIVTQNRKDTDKATVFWEKDKEWVSAKPRVPTPDEHAFMLHVALNSLHDFERRHPSL